MTNHLRLLAVLLASLFVSCGGVAERPNIIIVLTDDQGYGDLSSHGNPVLKTPNIDAFRTDSVRLADYHVAPTCSPTRSALQTGHWTNRTGAWHTIMGRSLLKENEVTMGQVFRDAGYETGLFGKWHLGDNYPFRPEDRGYTEVMRLGGGGVGQTPDVWDNSYFDGSYFHNGEREAVQGFCTDVWFDYAKRFIKSQKQSGKPFLAVIATNAPHGPMHAPEADSAPYADLPVDVANFYGMIANIDGNFGSLRTFLEEEGLAENTILVFTTDNGTTGGGNFNALFNAGMRGRKGSEYDGGHRVPFFVSWPQGGLAAGRDVEPITAHVDVLPTLIDLAGVPAPQDVQFDGVSIRALLEGSVAAWPERMLVTDSQRVKDPIKWKQSAVMTSRWRLINGVELYDMDADPEQQNDVAAQNPEPVERLKDFYEGWWAELEPTFADDAAIYLGHAAGNPAYLTAHDWITEGSSPWNQGMIREGVTGAENTGYWNVEIAAKGEYEIRLRRWPDGVSAALSAGLPAGEDVPGVQAYRARPGTAIAITRASIEIGGQQGEQAVAPDDQEAVFRLHLEPGRSRLLTRFFTSDGQEFGAYFAAVRKIG
ncbi:MAG: arylsulfatase [Acidobacteria bacterium]|nr:arylsulfatase [Acidobacteriota bacterium]MDA1236197.1 arylsulfatase [Acidobacteriota bacterium]